MCGKKKKTGGNEGSGLGVLVGQKMHEQEGDVF